MQHTIIDECPYCGTSQIDSSDLPDGVYACKSCGKKVRFRTVPCRYVEVREVVLCKICDRSFTIALGDDGAVTPNHLIKNTMRYCPGSYEYDKVGEDMK